MNSRRCCRCPWSLSSVVLHKIMTAHNPTTSVGSLRPYVVALAVVVLATTLTVYLSGRQFALALASAGLSVSLPGPTRLLLAGGWGLALVAILYVCWSCLVFAGKASRAQIIGHSLAGVLATVALQAWGLWAYTSPLPTLIR